MRTVTIHATTGRDAVLRVCREVLEFGREASPRGQRTLELSPVHVELRDPADTIPDGINRAKLQPAIAAAEALQNVAGVAQPGLMSRISSFFPKPTGRWDAGIPTYGERMAECLRGPAGVGITSQIEQAIQRLREDPDSREAVVAVWRAGDIVGGQAHNLCTCTLQLLIRGGRLDLFVNMRSNDAWYGLCYDLFQFAQVQLTAARCLGVPAGRYFHSAASMHLYERHWRAASALRPELQDARRKLLGVGWEEGQSWIGARERARLILGGCGDLESGVLTPTLMLTPTERWYVETLAPYDPDGR